MGSYEALVRQLCTGSPSEQHEAVAALLTLPLTPPKWLSAVGAIPRLAQLRSSASTTPPQARAIWNLLQMTSDYHEGGGDDAAPDGVIPPLVSLLRQDDAFVCYVAAMALSNLAVVADNKRKIMAAGAIGPLVQLLQSSSLGHHYAAARTLAFLAENCSIRTRIIAAGAIAPLLQLFSSSGVEIQHMAAMAVRIIACMDADPNPVAAAGAIPLLVHLLKTSSAIVQVEAAQALGLLAENADIIAEIVTAGAIPLLAGLLSASGPSAEALQLEAARALATAGAGAQSEIIAAGAIAPLVGFLESASEDMLSVASHALYELSYQNEAGQVRIAAAGAIAPLVRVLRTARSEVMQAHAVMTLTSLACNDAKSVVSAGALPVLVTCMTDRSAIVRERAAGALHAIAKDFNTHAAILEAAPLLPLARLLTSGSQKAQAFAHHALLHLSNAPTFPQQFVAAGAIPPLVQQLRSESALVQHRGMMMLGVLASKALEDISAPVEGAGALPLLANLQSAASTEEMRSGAGRLLQALTTGTGASPLASVSPSMTASVPPAAAAGLPSSSEAAALLPDEAASPQLQQLPPRPRKSCWWCGAKGVPLKKCSMCAVAAYCGAGCQKADWKEHKGQCAGLKAGASGGGASAAEVGEK